MIIDPRRVLSTCWNFQRVQGLLDRREFGHRADDDTVVGLPYQMATVEGWRTICPESARGSGGFPPIQCNSLPARYSGALALPVVMPHRTRLELISAQLTLSHRPCTVHRRPR